MFSLVLKGREGAEAILNIMEKLRKEPLKALGHLKVAGFRDYLTYESPIKIPKDNVLYILFEDNSWFAIRPSGTEPKIKIYLAVKGQDLEDSNKKIKYLRAHVEKLIMDLVPKELITSL